MAKKMEVYKCEVCGNIVEVLHGGVGKLVCCGKPMKMFEPKTQEEGKEKHLPVVETKPDGVKVKVGSVPHPMEEKHYIEWVELIGSDGSITRKFLKPGEAPEAEFLGAANIAEVREYCNVHGLWATKA
jgi:superoxide reductase